MQSILLIASNAGNLEDLNFQSNLCLPPKRVYLLYYQKASVYSRYRIRNGFYHIIAQSIVWFMEPRGIQKYQLIFPFGQYTHDFGTGCLWLA